MHISEKWHTDQMHTSQQPNKQNQIERKSNTQNDVCINARISLTPHRCNLLHARSHTHTNTFAAVGLPNTTRCKTFLLIK